MNKYRSKIIDFQEYKNKKEKIQTDQSDREELLNLIKRIVTIK